MEKKLPMIHSAIVVRIRSRGPVKKKIPLEENQYGDPEAS